MLLVSSSALFAERRGGPESIPRYEKSKFFSLGELFGGSSDEEKEDVESAEPEPPAAEDSTEPIREPLQEPETPAKNEFSELFVAVLQPTESHQTSGLVYFEKVDQGIKVSGRIQDLLPGVYGLSVHRYGDVSAADGTSLGGSFDPDSDSQEADETSDQAGNLGIIAADKDGVAEFSFAVKDFSLEGAGSILGRGLVIHRDSGDSVSGKTGAVGMAVIGVADPSAK